MPLTATDHQKLLRAGFTILRLAENPVQSVAGKEFPYIIKQKTPDQGEWHKHDQYRTKAARDREMKTLLAHSKIIED